jgi:hypothetical protein
MTALLAITCLPVIAQQVPTERAQHFAALPVWTGLWEPELSAKIFSGELDKEIGEAGKNPHNAPVVIAPRGALDLAEQVIMSHVQMLDKPPYNAAWDQRYEARKRMILTEPASSISPKDVQACRWQFPMVMEFPFDTLFQVLVTPEETLLLFQNGQARHLYTDREHPKPEDLWPSDMGNSVGRWAGDTLVLDTIATRSGPILGMPQFLSADLSEQAHFTERLHMIDPDTLQDEMTIEDPLRLARPWQLTLRYRRVKNLDRLIPTDCTENNRFRQVGRKMTITPTAPR